MTTSEILELVRAGYTKAEIESLSGAENQNKSTETVKHEEKTETEKEKEKTETVKQEEGKSDKSYTQLLEAVNSLSETVKAMQADNAKKASGEQPETETAESAIRSFFEDTPKN